MESQNQQAGQLECDEREFAGAPQTCTANSLVDGSEDIGLREMSIALVKGSKDQKPDNHPGTIRQFIEALKTPDQHNFEKDGLAFLQGPCPSGGGRSGIEAFELFGFDVDDGDDPEEVRDWCDKLGLCVIIYPTFNDGKVVNGKRVHKYRVIVFLDRAIKLEELGASTQEQKATLKSLRRHLAEWLSLNDDPACDGLPRIFYMHRRPKGVVSWFLCTKGSGSLCADALLEVARARVVSAKPKRKRRGKGRKDIGGNPSAERLEFAVFCRRFRDVMDVEQLVEDSCPRASDPDGVGGTVAASRCPGALTQCRFYDSWSAHQRLCWPALVGGATDGQNGR